MEPIPYTPASRRATRYALHAAFAGEGLVIDDGVPEHQTALTDKLQAIGARVTFQQ